jgi:hypothetical protein
LCTTGVSRPGTSYLRVPVNSDENYDILTSIDCQREEPQGARSPNAFEKAMLVGDDDRIRCLKLTFDREALAPLQLIHPLHFTVFSEAEGGEKV